MRTVAGAAMKDHTEGEVDIIMKDIPIIAVATIRDRGENITITTQVTKSTVKMKDMTKDIIIKNIKILNMKSLRIKNIIMKRESKKRMMMKKKY